MKESLRQRFDRKWMPEPFSGCWLWTDCTNLNGYGRIFIDGKARSASRTAYRLFRGEIPKGLQVLHRCDTPSCVNPDHLFLGNNSDNMRDSMLKDRRGLKLSLNQAYAIRNDPRTNSKISTDYGICPSSVSHIKTKKTWRHI